MDCARAWDILRDAEVICAETDVQRALHRLAGEIAARLSERYPLVLSVMGGSVVFSGQLLPMLRFPLEFDYLHATRYDGATRGGQLSWKVLPRQPLAGRTILVLDDILDEGDTMAAIKRRLLEDGAAEVCCAVFADKDLGRPKPTRADFIGVSVPDRYVFGFGMDVEEAWRNLPAIYALRGR
jgi:hypoxanthine phosphoribosyltransferase